MAAPVSGKAAVSPTKGRRFPPRACSRTGSQLATPPACRPPERRTARREAKQYSPPHHRMQGSRDGVQNPAITWARLGGGSFEIGGARRRRFGPASAGLQVPGSASQPTPANDRLLTEWPSDCGGRRRRASARRRKTPCGADYRVRLLPPFFGLCSIAVCHHHQLHHGPSQPRLSQAWAHQPLSARNALAGLLGARHEDSSAIVAIS